MISHKEIIVIIPFGKLSTNLKFVVIKYCEYSGKRHWENIIKYFSSPIHLLNHEDFNIFQLKTLFSFFL